VNHVTPPTRPSAEASDEFDTICRRIRRQTIEMIATVGKGHPGSSLSCIEILVSLYYSVMRWDPSAIGAEDRDRFVLSKGHAAPALYAVLLDRGVLPANEVTRLRLLGSPLQGHPDPRFTPGIEFATGSLGQGLSASVGMALGLKRRGSGARVFALVGDGECQEGQIWEAANFAAAQHLDNLVVVVDENRFQHDAPTASLVGVTDLAPRWSAFGWSTVTVDGHDVQELVSSMQASTGGRPRAVVARTVKGRGVPFMEANVRWHSIDDPLRLPEALAIVRAGE
jgi:transketolase